MRDHPLGLTTTQDVVVRWWSTYSMANRLIVLRPCFPTLQMVENGNFYPEDIRLTDEEWDIIEMANIVLEPLMFAQRLLEGELFVTNSLVAPILHNLRKFLNETLTRQQEQVRQLPNSSNIIECLEAMIAAFTERFGNGTDVVPLNTPYGNAYEGTRRQPKGLTLWQCISSGLDNRSKDLFWLPNDEHQNVWDAIGKMALSLEIMNTTGLPGRVGDTKFATGLPILVAPNQPLVPGVPTIIDVSPPSNPPSTGSSLTFHRGPANVIEPPAHAPQVFNIIDHTRTRVLIEIEQWKLVNVQTDLTFETLKWWDEHRLKFPLLARVARLVHAVPASAAPSERMWSEAGLIDRAERCKYGPG